MKEHDKDKETSKIYNEAIEMESVILNDEVRTALQNLK